MTPFLTMTAIRGGFWLAAIVALLWTPLHDNIAHFPADGPHLSLVFNTFAQWDSGWFIRIADHGYDVKQSSAFFPLYPVVVRGGCGGGALDGDRRSSGLRRCCRCRGNSHLQNRTAFRGRGGGLRQRASSRALPFRVCLHGCLLGRAVSCSGQLVVLGCPTSPSRSVVPPRRARGGDTADGPGSAAGASRVAVAEGAIASERFNL